MGSAQARKHGVVLQHGTLPLYGDITRIADVLSASEEKRQDIREGLRQSAITLEACAGRPISYEQAARSLGTGFAYTLNLQLQAGQLSAWEKEQATVIRADKFANLAWSSRL